ncbi:MAG TPA: hypothetical protein VGF29_05860 [Hyphomicrobiaceae bacterium]|jgi:hypothetical protein
MNIIDWDPAKGDLCQGDVVLFRIPDRLKLDTGDEAKPRDHRLILAKGELTGHHHAIWNPQPAMFRDDGLARELLRSQGVPDDGATAAKLSEAKAGARLYRDPEAVRVLIGQGELAHNRLAIGFLVVEGGPVVLRHDEHDAVRIPPGRYYVGGQSEWDAAEERRVAD